MAKIIVKYWQGTTPRQATATTYRGAMRIASRNRNKFDATFWTPEGERLIDTGSVLVTEAEAARPIGETVTAHA